MSFEFTEECDRPDLDPAGRGSRTFLTRMVPFRHAPRAVRRTGALVWLAFILFPLINAVGKHGTALERGLVIAGAAVFVVTYVTMVLTWRLARPSRVTVVLFLVLVSVATALTVGQSSGWGFLFTYCAACTALVARKALGFYAVALCAILAAVTTSVAGADGGNVISFVASTAGIGMLMLVMGDLRLRNLQLSEARGELAQLAVAQERERFARDLHDLLGHSLSVITLKAELAGRMLGDRAGDAAREVAELEQVARNALSEVREAVSGYRQPTLEGELGGARMALSAAGIQAEVHEAHVPLDPPVEAVLAWAVREGATNVIRHSHARHCTLRVTTTLTDAGVEVIDDGAGMLAGRAASRADAASLGVPSVVTEILSRTDVGDTSAGPSFGNGFADLTNGVGSERVANGNGGPGGHAGQGGHSGHGLAGLAERARLVNGTLEAGALPGGGYRLAVTVPISHA